MSGLPFFVEAMDEADAEQMRREVVEWMRDRDPFIEELIEEFRFPDRAALAEEIAAVGHFRYPNAEVDDRLGDTLDRLDAPIARVIGLLDDDVNAWRIYRSMASRDPARAECINDELRELPGRLRVIRAAAKAAHRERDQRSGPLPALDLRELAERLARFYASTGRPFTHDHKNWAPGKDNIPEPTGKQYGALFVFRVVEHLMPGRGKYLKNILRHVKVG